MHTGHGNDTFVGAVIISDPETDVRRDCESAFFDGAIAWLIGQRVNIASGWYRISPLCQAYSEEPQEQQNKREQGED